MRRRSLRCIGMGECRKHEQPDDVPELHGHARGTSTARAAARTCCSRCSRASWSATAGTTKRSSRRSTCACRARRANRSARRTSTSPTYQAEFLAHYYAKRRPAAPPLCVRPAVDRWGTGRGRSPAAGQRAQPRAGSIARPVKRWLEIAQEREIPKSRQADVSRTGSRTGRRHDRGGGRPRHAGASAVVLWLDTFTDLFDPTPARPRSRCSRRPGSRVEIPARAACAADGRCTTSGCSTLAKRTLRNDPRDALGSRSTPASRSLVLEPSCASVFRDELRNLFPADARATRLRNQTFLLGEFLESRHVSVFSLHGSPGQSCSTDTVIRKPS